KPRVLRALDSESIMVKQVMSVEKLPALIATFSAAILVVSVSYDYGFLLWLGVSLAEAPTSLSDHIRSSLIWAPTILLMVFGVTVMELFNRRIEQGMTEEELIATSPIPKFTAWFRYSLKYPVYAFVIFLPITPFLGVKLPLQAWMFGSIIWWFILHNFFFNHQRIMERTSRSFYLTSRWLPAALLLVVFFGAIAAEKVPNGKLYEFNIGDDVEQRVLARSYDQYFMVWNPDSKRIEFVSKNSVKSFQQVRQDESNKPIQPTAGVSAD
ncbi:hypothetical protein, partial [Marinomonas sp. BSi20414]